MVPASDFLPPKKLCPSLEETSKPSSSKATALLSISLSPSPLRRGRPWSAQEHRTRLRADHGLPLQGGVVSVTVGNGVVSFINSNTFNGSPGTTASKSAAGTTFDPSL